MKKHVMLFTTLTIWGLAHAFPNVGRIAFRVVVLDERSGLPLKNVPVTAVFTDNPVHWGDDSVERVEHLLTDAKGMCRVVGTSNHGAASYVVEKMPGYHATSMVRYKATNEFSSIIPIPYRCEPYDCVYTTLLQRIEHPIPLYAHGVSLKGRNGITGFDGTNIVLRYDFIDDDWLPPHGNGKHVDMTITTRLEMGKSLNIWKSHKTTLYDFISTIKFHGKGNGLIEQSISGHNCGIRIRTAPESDYMPSKTMRFGRRKKNTSGPVIYPEYYTESDDDHCYCFRIRSRYNDEGKLVEAYYGKIYGDFKLGGYYDVGLREVDFKFYLNLRSLDRNLEWDTNNNFCPHPGNLIYKLSNQPRLEP
ncbi:MAG: hypothetical protein IJL17_02325 [Kiritimatiellae bacterium]|nr:hypothetical protein [Kiritimatiellia bacterium]